MGLFYERLGNVRTAKEAYIQAWNELIKKRKNKLQRSAEAAGSDFYIEVILGQAKATLCLARLQSQT